MAKIERVLVPVDLGPSSARIVDYARMLARPFGASIVLIHVVPNVYVASASEVYIPPSQDLLDELVQDDRERLNELVTDSDRDQFKMECVVPVADPVCGITEYAAEHAIDLIVMGTHGRAGVAHLVLGSVAERVVRTAPCPVLTIR